MSDTTNLLPGFKLQAPDGAPSQTVSFGQAFLPGAVPSGSGLAMVAGGVTTPVQMEVRTRHPDGSVAHAQVILPQPALAAGQTLDAAFVLAPPSKAPAVDLAAALSKHSATVDLAFADGTPVHVDVIAAARDALASGAASHWQRGQYATQARVEVPVSGSLHLFFDLTADASGNFKLDAHFNNDLAMGETGGAVTYSAKVALDGKTAQQPQLTQYQYQNWNMVLESKPASFINVQHDIDYFERTGLLQNFDQERAKFFSDSVAANAARLDDADWGQPFAPHDILQWMPAPGGRPDIGPTTGANANWVLTQDADAARYALGQAGATDGIPWHFRDVATGRWLNTDGRPGLWTDPRGRLTQQMDEGNNGWTPQRAHAPDPSYIPYLLTGERALLDELNAQASWAVTDTWDAQRGATDDIVTQYQEVRGDAWSLRTVQEAAWVNPDGSPEAAYFAGVTAHNWEWLVSMIPQWTAYQGEAYGHVPMEMGEPQFAPWQQDYLATTAVQAVLNGDQDAKTFLEWQSHFLAQRFLNADAGMDPRTGVSYQLRVKDAQGNDLHTWREINDETVAAGMAGDYWPDGDYAELAVMSLAGTMTALGDSEGGLAAMKAYGLLAASDAPYLTADSQFQIAPRLADGRLLTWSNIIVSHSAAGTTNTVQGPDAGANQLLYAGAGADTLVGGKGVNLLYAGTGSATLRGGAGRDYMFGRWFGTTGAARFEGGAGDNYMEAGKGRDTFVVEVSDAARDTIVGFRADADTIQVSGATEADVARWISGATATGGDTVLALSATHSLTLKGFAPSQLEASMFTGATTGGPAPITIGTGADTVTLGISEDAYKGDAQYVVLLDGVQVGGTQTASASHAAGQSQLVHVKGDFTHGARQLGVKFLNDRWGGTASTDRNLYVDSVAVNGVDTKQSAALMRAGTRSFAVGSDGAAEVGLGTGADTVTLGISEDAYKGDAQYVVLLDGVQVGGTQTASASHAAGQSQRVHVRGDFSHGARRLEVQFLNDHWEGTPSTDRNLYVDSVAVNGVDTKQSAALFGNGSHGFTVGSGASGADSVVGVSARAADTMAFMADPQAEAPAPVAGDASGARVAADTAASDASRGVALSGLALGAAAAPVAPAGSASGDSDAAAGGTYGASLLAASAPSASAVLPVLQDSHL